MQRRKDHKGRVLKDGESYRSCDGLYMYRWTEDGKRHYLYNKDLDKLREMEKKVIKDEVDGIKADGKYKTVNDIYLIWKETKAGVRNSTKANYYYSYEHYIQEDFGSRRIVNVTKSDIKRLYNKLIDKSGLSISTVENINNVLRQVFEVAVDDNIIRNNVVNGVLGKCKKERQYERTERTALTEEEQALFLSFLRDTPKFRYWYPFFVIGFGTGCRIGELAALCWKNVDIENRQITVKQTLSSYNKLEHKAEKTLGKPKSKKGTRELPLLPEVVDALLEQKKTMTMLGRKCKEPVNGRTDFVFINKEGNPINSCTMNSQIKRLVKYCNEYEKTKAEQEGREPVIIPDFSNHVMRHSFCTRYVECESRLPFVQAYMGHSDVRTTMSYVSTDTKKLKASLEDSNLRLIGA